MGASLAQLKKLRREVVMKLKNRYSLWRFRGNLFESRAMRRLRRSGGGDKFSVGDVFIAASVLMLFSFDIFPEGIPFPEWVQMLAALVALIVGLILNYRRLAPRTCWSRAAWASGLWAAAMTILPFVLYWTGEIPEIEMAYMVVAVAVVVWFVCLGCVLRLRYVRRRSRTEIALMRMRRKRAMRIM